MPTKLVMIMTAFVTGTLLFVVIVEMYQSARIYDDYLSCESNFDQLNKENNNLYSEIKQLEMQLTPVATSEFDLSATIIN